MMISTVSIRFIPARARKLTQPLIPPEERFEMSVDVQVQMNASLTVTSRQRHCAMPENQNALFLRNLFNTGLLQLAICINVKKA